MNRKDRAVQGWRAWLLEDPLVHPYTSGSGLIWFLPLPFFSVILVIRLMGLEFLLTQLLLMLSLGRLGCLISVGLGGGAADLDDFSYEVGGGWLPVL